MGGWAAVTGWWSGSGRAGLSVVWRGYDEVLGRQVAIKVQVAAALATAHARRGRRAEAVLLGAGLLLTAGLAWPARAGLRAANAPRAATRA
jgi:uncharacterized membrane protein YhfC